MTDRLDLFFRALTVPVTPQKEYRSKRRAAQPKHALIFRCAATGDEKKDLLFGAYICAELENEEYVAKEIGLSYREGHPEEFRALTRFVKDSSYELGSVEEFRRGVLLKYLKARALIVAYDAPLEISRIAIKWNKSTKTRRAFSFYFRMFRDKKNGMMRPSGYEPARTTVQSKSQLGKIRKLLFEVLCSCVFTALPLSARVHYAYVTNYGDNTVSVIDTATQAVLNTIPVGTNPYGVAVGPGSKFVYVTSGRVLRKQEEI